MIQPPTSRLPPIAKIATFTSTQLFDSLQYLQSLYRPQVRGSRRLRLQEGNSLCLILSPHNDDDVQHIQFDAFERAYAIRWLTVLIAQLDARQEQCSSSTPTPSPITIHAITNNGTQPPSSLSDPDLPIDTDILIQQAASLLATCAGVAAAPKLRRRFSFQSPVLPPPPMVGSIDDADTDKLIIPRAVHVDLTDIPLDNHDYASVGAQTWGGACVLAEMIAERPDRFGLGCLTGTRLRPSAGRDGLDVYDDGRPPLSGSAPGRPLRILELGAGTGLVGLTAAKLLQASLPPCKAQGPNSNTTHHPRATIVLTDFYPAVLANLQSNIDVNFPTAAPSDENDTQAAIVVHSRPLDWSSFSSTTEMLPIPDVLSTPFDLVFGADIVYEARHAVWIRDCLTSLLAYPDGLNEDPVFHLVIPLRATHTFESSTVEEVFGSKGRGSEGSQRELTILSKDSIVCEAYRDGWFERSRTDDDVVYVYYRIGWTR